MTTAHEVILQRASQPLPPLDTSQQPQLTQLAGIQAVLFDIYGTLMVSGVGDIGLSMSDSNKLAVGATPFAAPTPFAAAPTPFAAAPTPFAAALSAAGLDYSGDGQQGVQLLHQQIQASHQTDRAAGIPYPEVDIVEIWLQTCDQLANRGELSTPPPADFDYQRLAIEYEVRTNPVWPMPGLKSCLKRLTGLGQVLGIISNAQFFTPLLFPAVVGATLDQLGFDRRLCFYSYCNRQAKPSGHLYQLAATALAQQGINPSAVLYVGNDLRNDIWPAAQVGYKTALFAGDARSLRLRENDPNRTQYGQPDAIVTHLEQISKIVES
jgi:putative hydrolase of the HAD superfamily